MKTKRLHKFLRVAKEHLKSTQIVFMKRIDLFLLALAMMSSLFSKEKEAELFETAPFDQKALILTPATVNLKEEQMIVSIAPLYFKTQLKGSSYALANKDAELFLPQRSEVKSPSAKWNFGIRAGVGRVFNKDKLLADVQFTYLRTADSKKTTNFAYGSLIPLRGSFYEDSSFAKSSLKLKYYNLDVSLARDYFVCKRLSVKPQISVKSSWLESLQNTYFIQPLELLTQNVHVEECSKMWGLGPMGAFTTKWYVLEDVFFFGKTAASALFSYLRGYQHSLCKENLSQNLSIFEKEHFFVPYLELDLGLCFYKILKDSKKLLQFSLAYESQYYFHARQVLDLEEFKDTLRVKTTYEDISLYGVTFTASLNF